MKKERFEVLDGLRGVAAVIVVLYHVGNEISGVSHLARHGWVAVDFFFMLSGFIIAHAYDAKLASGLGAARFMTARVKRLYPLYIIGTLIGAASITALTLASGKAIEASTITLLVSAGVVFVPVVGSKALVFVLNGPAWSLFYEVLANLAYAAGFKLMSKRVLAGMSVLGFLGLLASHFTYGHVDTGWGGENFIGGLARITFAFPLGALIYRLHVEGRFAAVRRVSPALLIAILVVLTCVPVQHNTPVDLLIIAGVFPLFLILAAQARFAKPEPMLLAAGDLSYALYATHASVMMMVMAVQVHYALSPLVILITLPASVLVAMAAQALTSPSCKKAVDSRLAVA